MTHIKENSFYTLTVLDGAFYAPIKWQNFNKITKIEKKYQQLKLPSCVCQETKFQKSSG